MSRTKAAGDRGEAEVAKYLRKKGYTLLASQWRCRFGELDLVARDKRGTLCFVEVKYRANLRCGTPQEAVHAQKQEKIIQVARYYMMKHGLNEWTPCRFDVVAITGEDAVLFRNAFEIR